MSPTNAGGTSGVMGEYVATCHSYGHLIMATRTAAGLIDEIQAEQQRREGTVWDRERISGALLDALPHRP